MVLLSILHDLSAVGCPCPPGDLAASNRPKGQFQTGSPLAVFYGAEAAQEPAEPEPSWDY
eukprot:364906-Chlamydomonas_euryale.AAC.10